MWISPSFHLQVIRAYDEMIVKQLEKARNNSMGMLHIPEPISPDTNRYTVVKKRRRYYFTRCEGCIFCECCSCF